MYFTIDKDKDARFVWRLRTDDHEVVAYGQPYATKDACEQAIDVVVSATKTTPIHDLTATGKGVGR